MVKKIDLEGIDEKQINDALDEGNPIHALVFTAFVANVNKLNEVIDELNRLSEIVERLDKKMVLPVYVPNPWDTGKTSPTKPYVGDDITPHKCPSCGGTYFGQHHTC
jgi:hypothetical protein